MNLLATRRRGGDARQRASRSRRDRAATSLGTWSCPSTGSIRARGRRQNGAVRRLGNRITPAGTTRSTTAVDAYQEPYRWDGGSSVGQASLACLVGLALTGQTADASPDQAGPSQEIQTNDDRVALTRPGRMGVTAPAAALRSVFAGAEDLPRPVERGDATGPVDQASDEVQEVMEPPPRRAHASRFMSASSAIETPRAPIMMR